MPALVIKVIPGPHFAFGKVGPLLEIPQEWIMKTQTEGR
jgi:hypothetical protein